MATSKWLLLPAFGPYGPGCHGCSLLMSKLSCIADAKREQCLRGTFNYKPQRGLAKVGQGRRVNSGKLITKAANSLPIALERQVCAGKEKRG